MAISRRRTLAPEWWTPESEEDEESPAQFLLKSLTTPEVELIMSKGGNDGFSVANHDAVIKLGLVDWDNIIDPDTGLDEEFSASGAAMLDMVTRSLIVNRIFELITVSEEDAKN